MTAVTPQLHRFLDSGVEFAADLLPARNTVAINFRVLVGIGHDPDDLSGVGSLVERTLSKGTAKFDGRGLADAFDRLGIQWSSVTGRQSTLIRAICLPEFTGDAVDLVCEMLARPTFPDDACKVAIELAQQELKHLEDEPDELVRIIMNRLTLGPKLGRYASGTPKSLAKITPRIMRDHWRSHYTAGRMQVVAAGPIDADALIARLDKNLRGFGDSAPRGRENADHPFSPQREHRQKDLEQEYISIAMPGLPRSDPEFATEQVVIGVLAGGMSGRLFTEVREKQGLVYWVGAWHEQPRGQGIIHLGASTTPERCRKTFDTLMREIERLSEDLTEAEVVRARNSLLAHAQTEDDMTRARAAGLSDDLFHYGKPIGLEPKLDAVRAVTLDRVHRYVQRIPRDRLCVATLGKTAL